MYCWFNFSLFLKTVFKWVLQSTAFSSVSCQSVMKAAKRLGSEAVQQHSPFLVIKHSCHPVFTKKKKGPSFSPSVSRQIFSFQDGKSSINQPGETLLFQEDLVVTYPTSKTFPSWVVTQKIRKGQLLFLCQVNPFRNWKPHVREHNTKSKQIRFKEERFTDIPRLRWDSRWNSGSC